MGSERVKGSATRSGVAHPRHSPSRVIFRNFSVKVVARILRRILVTLYIYTRIMVTIKKRAGVIPYIFSSSIALLSSLLPCSFYLLDLRTISSVDILEMT